MIMLKGVWPYSKGERTHKTSLSKCCCSSEPGMFPWGHLSISEKFVGCHLVTSAASVQTLQAPWACQVFPTHCLNHPHQSQSYPPFTEVDDRPGKPQEFFRTIWLVSDRLRGTQTVPLGSRRLPSSLAPQHSQCKEKLAQTYQLIYTFSSVVIYKRFSCVIWQEGM